MKIASKVAQDSKEKSRESAVHEQNYRAKRRGGGGGVGPFRVNRSCALLYQANGQSAISSQRPECHIQIYCLIILELKSFNNYLVTVGFLKVSRSGWETMLHAVAAILRTPRDSR